MHRHRREASDQERCDRRPQDRRRYSSPTGPGPARHLARAHAASSLSVPGWTDLASPMRSVRRRAARSLFTAHLAELCSRGASGLAQPERGNIVVDDSDDRLGIIDFGSCFVTHPALDVASLSVLGTRLLEAAARAYPLLGSLGGQAEAVRQSFMCQDALYAARQQDWDYVRSMFTAAR